MISETLIDRVFLLLNQGLSYLDQMNFKGIEASQLKDLEMMITFVSKAFLHDFKLCSLPLQDQALIILITALRLEA